MQSQKYVLPTHNTVHCYMLYKPVKNFELCICGADPA